ncbi:MAG: hypothetical protein JWQ94_3513 [Tardiphaga sp.]|jgi:hypothetical protein|nr:hypothetical protein [Tardiphaga sp.]
MLKLVSVAITVLTMWGPASAQTLQKPDCGMANIAHIEEQVTKMKDGRNKDTAASEIATAKEMLAKGQFDECQSALLKASVQTK